MKTGESLPLLVLLVGLSIVIGTVWFGSLSNLSPPYDPDRLSQATMESLVAGPIAHVREGQLKAAIAEIDTLRARESASRPDDPFARADVDESFGVLLFLEDGGDNRFRSASLPFLERAISEYRDRLTSEHPEVALALQSYADVLVAVDPRANARDARTAYCEAFRIRRASLGARHAETGAALAALARMNPESEAAIALRRFEAGALPARVSVARIMLDALSWLTPGLVEGWSSHDGERARLETAARDPQFIALCTPDSHTAAASRR